MGRSVPSYVGYITSVWQTEHWKSDWLTYKVCVTWIEEYLGIVLYIKCITLLRLSDIFFCILIIWYRSIFVTPQGTRKRRRCLVACYFNSINICQHQNEGALHFSFLYSFIPRLLPRHTNANDILAIQAFAVLKE